KLYKKKLEKLTASLAPFAPAVKISGEQAGMHVVLTVKSELTEKQLIDRAKAAGIRVFGLHSYDVEKSESPSPRIVIGFGGLSELQIEQGIHKLMASWEIGKTKSSSSGER